MMIALYRIKQLTNSSLVKNSIVYVITDGINKAIPFILLPFISRYLTPADYGIVSNYSVYIQILSVVVYLCTAGIIPVMFFKVDRADLKVYISNMLLINTVASLLCLIVAFFGNKIIDQYLSIPFFVQAIGILSVWFTSFTNINLVLWRCEEKPLWFGSYQISQSMLSAVTTVLFVMVLLMGWKGRVYSMMVSCIIMGIISLWMLHARGYMEYHFSVKHVKSILIFSLPLLPHALSFWFKSGTDKILLTNLCGLSDNGLFSVALTWGAVVSLILVAYNNSYSPFLFKKLSEFDKNRDDTMPQQQKLVKVIWLSLAVTFLSVALIYVICHFLTYIIYPESYYGSLDYLPLVMVSQAFNGAYLLFVCFCHYTLKTKVLGAITFSLSLMQVLLSYLLIKQFGPIGVAYSAATISIATFFAVAIYAMRIYRLPWFKIMLHSNDKLRKI